MRDIKSMRTITTLTLAILLQLPRMSSGFTNLGQTYVVDPNVTFNQVQPQDYLVGTLNVQGTYNLIGNGFFPDLYVNNLNISGSFKNNGGTIVNSSGYYYDNFDIVVTPTGAYNQTRGSIWPSIDSITNQGTFQISGGDIYVPSYKGVFQNAGTLTINGGSFNADKLDNTGVINANQRFAFGDILNLNISNGVV